MAGVIGLPVRHSLSPVIHAAAFEALGLDWASAAFEVADGDAARAVDGIRALGIRGMSVTMPHKAAVVPLLDELAPSAERLGVVNCIHNDDGHLVGHSTDGAGFVGALRADATFDAAGRRCLVIGAGGAARSIVAALADAQAAEVAVRNRTRSKADETIQLAGPLGSICEEGDDLGRFDLVVNTTSIGMSIGADGDESMPCNPDELHAEQLAVDIIYKPLETRWLAAARSRGLPTLNGVGMLVHQAVEQIRIWTGQEPPVAAMVAAAEAQLAGGR